MPIDTKELMKQVGRIRLFTTRKVDEHLSGDYHSVFKGQGIDFDEVREYVPGDEIRSIDWNVTARMGHPYVKRYREERELTIIFLVDVSGSQCFGSGSKTKSELAAETTCILALSAIKNQDKVGLILFSDRIEKVIPPRKGRTAVVRLVREVLATEETRHGTDIAGALRFLNRIQKRKAIVFLISDFQDKDFGKELAITARRHDVIGFPITDPRESTLADAGLIEVEDPETGALHLLDTGSRAIRERFGANARTELAELTSLFTRVRVDSRVLSTATPVFEGIRELFKKREKRVRRGR